MYMSSDLSEDLVICYARQGTLLQKQHSTRGLVSATFGASPKEALPLGTLSCSPNPLPALPVHEDVSRSPYFATVSRISSLCFLKCSLTTSSQIPASSSHSSIAKLTVIGLT